MTHCVNKTTQIKQCCVLSFWTDGQKSKFTVRFTCTEPKYMNDSRSILMLVEATENSSTMKKQRSSLKYWTKSNCLKTSAEPEILPLSRLSSSVRHHISKPEWALDCPLPDQRRTSTATTAFDFCVQLVCFSFTNHKEVNNNYTLLINETKGEISVIWLREKTSVMKPEVHKEEQTQTEPLKHWFRHRCCFVVFLLFTTRLHHRWCHGFSLSLPTLSHFVKKQLKFNQS